MLGGGEFKKYENGWSISNGKIRDGAYQTSSEYLSYTKRSLSRTRESSWVTICDVEH